MAFDINSLDNEFAVATGANVDVDPDHSRFDYPPNSTKDLIITTHDGDTEPRFFEVGDTYDLTWSGGSGGGGTLTDAVVVRSDSAGDGGVIVFEGYVGPDKVHVIWTPGFDLEQWYWDNYNPPPNEPQFFTSDQNASYTHGYICFEASTRIETPHGLVAAGRLREGDEVRTWDGAVERVLWTARRRFRAVGRAAPVRIKPGSFGNFGTLVLSPQHRIMIASPWAELHFGSSEVLVPAKALVDDRRVLRATGGEVVYVHLLLRRHELLIAEGAPCESLLPSFRTRDLLTARQRHLVRKLIGPGPHLPVRPILTLREAILALDGARPVRALVASL